MSLFTIGDLHLSLSASKPMDVFGGEWVGYVDKITEGFKAVSPEDTVVLLGDLCWADNLKSSAADFKFISELPGRKIIVKGNHDYWWETVKKMNAFFALNGFNDLNILHNNCYLYENIALCGTRGWFYEEDRGDGSDKVYRREVARLETSLKAGQASGADRIFAFLHYPPVYAGYDYKEITGLLLRYGVEKCFYGHLHGHSRRRCVEGIVDKTEYKLASGDHIGFKPLKII
ncbi:MAG: metallophosphoesterase [Oscillospiraceae bacterium]|jgi:predicted phosphohydrolase|nr:metallophosphoesterase [Oscillospiraceae bacterium]